MSEVKYESKVVSCHSSISSVYRVCSDLRNLSRMKEQIPQDKVRDMEFEEDLVRFKVDGLGQKVGLRIVSKEEDDYIKYGIENAPVDGNFWIQMKENGEHETRLRLTIKVDLPMMFKMMVGNKLQTAIDQAADMMAQIPFEQWTE
jgi:uncharacterized membrane protein